MGKTISQNETDAAQRTLGIYLMKTDGTPQTDLTGLTITYMKPGGSDVVKTLSSDGAGRYRLALLQSDVDTTGKAWVSITGTGVLPFVDDVDVVTPVESRVWNAVRTGFGTVGTFGEGVGVVAIASTAANTVRDALLNFSTRTGRTVRGVFRRVDAFVSAPSNDLDSTSPTFMQPDGTTPEYSLTQSSTTSTRTGATVTNSETP